MFLRKYYKSGGEAFGDFISTAPSVADDEQQPIILIKQKEEKIPWELYDSHKLQGLFGIEFRRRLNSDFSFEQTIREWAEAIEDYTQKVLIREEALWSNNFRTLQILFEENSIIPIVNDTFLVFSHNVEDKGIKIISRAEFQKRFKELFIPNLTEYNSPFKAEKIGGIPNEIFFKNRVPRIGIRYPNFIEKKKGKNNVLPKQVLVENNEVNVVGLLLDLQKIYKKDLLIRKYSDFGIKPVFPVDPELIQSIKLVQRGHIQMRYFPLTNDYIRDLIERTLVYGDFIKSYLISQTNYSLKIIEIYKENLQKKLEKKASIPKELIEERERNFPQEIWNSNKVYEIYGKYLYNGQIRDISVQRYFWLRWNYLGVLPFYQIMADESPSNLLKLRVRLERFALEEQYQREKEKKLLEEELFAIAIREVYSPVELFKKQGIAKKEQIPLRLTLTENEFKKVENYLKYIQKYINSREVNQCPHFKLRRKVDFSIIWDQRYDALEELLLKYGKNAPEKATQKIRCCNCGFTIACNHEKLLLDAWNARDKEDEINHELEKNYYEVEGGNEDMDHYIHCRYCGRKIKDLNLEAEVQFDEDGRRVLGVIVEKDRDYIQVLEMEIEKALVFNRFQGIIRVPEIERSILQPLDYDITQKVLQRKDISIEQKSLLQKAYIVSYIYAFLIHKILRSNFRINFEAGYYKGEPPPKKIEGFGIVFLRIIQRIDPLFLTQLRIKDIKIGPILINAFNNLSRASETEGGLKGQYNPYRLKSLEILRKSDPKKGDKVDLNYFAWLAKKKLEYYKRIYADKFIGDQVWQTLATLEGVNLSIADFQWKVLEYLWPKVRIFPDKPEGYLQVPEKDKYFNFILENYMPNGAKRKQGDKVIVLKNLVNGKKAEMKQGALEKMLKAQVKEFNAGYDIPDTEINAFNSPEWLRSSLEAANEIPKLDVKGRTELREKVIHYENSQIVRDLLESACSVDYILYFPEANFICSGETSEEGISQKLIDTFLNLILPLKRESKPEKIPHYEIKHFTLPKDTKVETSKIEDDTLIFLAQIPKNSTELMIFSQIDFVISLGRELEKIGNEINWEIIRNAENLKLKERLYGSINLVGKLVKKDSSSAKKEIENAKEWTQFYKKSENDYQLFEELQELNTRKRFETFQRLTPEEKMLKGLFLADFREDQELFGKLDDDKNIEENKANIEAYEETNEMMDKDFESITDEDTAFLGTDLDFL